MGFRGIGRSRLLLNVTTRLRQKRFETLRAMLNRQSGPVSILDVGGSVGYWDLVAGGQLPDRCHVTLVNLHMNVVHRANVSAATGDARAMPQFADGQFDIVFSNSTIEHVGSLDDQRRMAREVRRIGRRYYVQTPNRNFPIEAHYLFPFFQFFPLAVRVWLARHLRLGWYGTPPSDEQLLDDIRSIRLLTRAELEQLFPEATILEERWCGLVKSFVVYAEHVEAAGTRSTERQVTA